MRGSLINNLMQGNGTVPEVGMGVTFLHYTDRSAGTIVEVISERKIIVQADEANRVDTNGMSESQTYEYSPRPDAKKITVTRRKNGVWKISKEGTAVAVGFRQTYHDFSF